MSPFLDQPDSEPPLNVQIAKVLGKTRIRGNVKDVFKGSPKGTLPAILSLEENLKDDNTTYVIEGAVGIPFQFEPTEDVQIELLLFGYLNEINSDKSRRKLVEVKSFGTALNAYFPIGDMFESQLTLDTHYTHDGRFESGIATGRVLWTPVPAFKSEIAIVESLRKPTKFLYDNWILRSYITAEVSYSHIIDKGSDPIFTIFDEYTLVGATAGTSLEWVDISKVLFGQTTEYLKTMKFYTNYTLLHGVNGPLDTFERFEAGAIVNFGQSENFGFSLNYKNGDLEDTLQDVESYTAGLSVRF